MFARFLLIAVIMFTVGCAAKYSPFPKTEEHIVGSGDTLYSIAFEHDKDYRNLAHWNDIKSPYKIYTGQMLVLHGYHPLAKNADYPRPEDVAAQEKAREQKIATRPVKQSPNSQVREVEVRTLPPPVATSPAQDNNTDKKSSGTTVAKAPPAVAAPPVPVTPPASRPASKPVTKQQTIPKYDAPWIWPVKGKVIEGFSSTNKGLDITGAVGTPIKATAAGKVVYAGEGLKGYGLLLIVKHGQNYLSAYGHNERLLVVQGEQIKQGQHIATLGRGPENQAMLHFEIRKNGKPVNPKSLLPK